jgi:HSP20 family protein
MQPEPDREPRTQPVPLKVFRSIDRLTVAAPMPGLDPEDVTVEVTREGRLVLEARLCREPKVLCGSFKSNKDVLLDEWSAGPYQRELQLTDPVDAQRATLTYGNGILVVALPLAEQHRPARLSMATIGPSRGERAGRPEHTHPRTAEEMTVLGATHTRDR